MPSPNLINDVSNNPNSSGSDELLTAAAIQQLVAGISLEVFTVSVITADVAAAVKNTIYVSEGGHTINLPDPNGLDGGGEPLCQIGDKVIIDQMADIGAVTQDSNYAEYLDSTVNNGDSGIRVIFEVMKSGTNKIWKKIVVTL